MDKLFIDTNVFEGIGFNFDNRNILIKVITNNVNDGKYEYCCLSIIDNEIKAHISKKASDDEKNLLKHYKWIKNYIDEQMVYNNCYKNLIDYERFKENISCCICDVSKINPEKIFDKYFSFAYPFENKENKKNEFPDAFISEYVNNLSKDMSDKIYFISNDNGLCKSLDDSILKYETIDEFLVDINGIEPDKYLYIYDLIKKSIKSISNDIFLYIDWKVIGLEDEIIEPSKIVLDNDFIFDVLDVNDEDVYVRCKFKKVSFFGEFSCIDREKSYWPNDEEYYVYIEYLKADKIVYEDFDLNFKIKNFNDDYVIEYDSCYCFDINYEKVKEYATSVCPYEYYDGEDSWTQDGYEMR